LENHLQPEGFSALWGPGVLVFVLVIGFLYFMLVGPWRQYFKHSQPVGRGAKAWFVAAMLVYYASQGSPLAYYAHNYLFSAHMLQMSLAYLAVPPMIYMALPGWAIQAVLDSRLIKPWISLAMHPLITLLGFNFIFSMYHVPLIFNAVFDHPFYHQAVHFVLLFLAFHMWFPIFNTVSGRAELSDLKKMGYIFADGVLLTPACATIIFANKLLYEHYMNAPQLFFLLPPLDDQQLGGVIMKIAQEIIYGIILAHLFFTWYSKERKKEQEEDELLYAKLSAQGKGNLNGV
jgi:putative membrane protein